MKGLAVLALIASHVSAVAALQPPVGATTLATRLWLIDRLLSVDEAASIRKTVLRLPSYPCPLQEQAWPTKRCAKVPVSAILAARLSSAWPALNLTNLATIAASIDLASDDTAMRHRPHHDVFPERAAGSRGPDATAVIYLTGPPSDDHPIEMAGATVFPRHGKMVAPRVGRMLAWSNVRDDGSADEAAEHGVGPYACAAGGALPPRIALHVPILAAHAQPEQRGIRTRQAPSGCTVWFSESCKIKPRHPPLRQQLASDTSSCGYSSSPCHGRR